MALAAASPFLLHHFLDLCDQRVGLKLLLELVHVRVTHRNVHAGVCRKHFSGRNIVPCPRVRYGVRAYEVAQDLRAALGGLLPRASLAVRASAATGQPRFAAAAGHRGLNQLEHFDA